MNRLKIKHKGFTLVEVIVVLVILAILAALLVPRLTGYINEAKDKEVALAFHHIESAVLASGAEVENMSELSNCLVRVGGTSNSNTQEGKKFIANVCSYLEADYDNQVEVVCGPNLSSYNSVGEAMEAGQIALWYYLPDRDNFNTIYTCTNGEITKLNDGKK